MCTPPQGPPTLPHSRIYTSAFAQQNLFHRIHAFTFTQPHSRSTYAAALTPPGHPCSSIDAAALQLQRPHSTYSAALTLPQHSFATLTRQHLCCTAAAALSPPHFCRSIHASACIGQHLCCRSLAPAFTLPHLCRSIYATTFLRCSIDSVALAMPYLCHRIDASACTPLQLSCRMHTAAFTPLSRSSIDAVALMQQHWCRRSDAAAFMQHLARRSIFGCSISPPISRCSSHAVAFTLPHEHSRIYAAALAGALCRWKWTTRSAFSDAQDQGCGPVRGCPSHLFLNKDFNRLKKRFRTGS